MMGFVCISDCVNALVNHIRRYCLNVFTQKRFWQGEQYPFIRSLFSFARRKRVSVSGAGMKSLEQSLSQKSLPRVTSPPGTAKKLSLVDARQQASVLAQLKHVDNLLQTSKSMVR